MSSDSGAKFLDAIIGLALLFFITVPLGALAMTWTLETIWDWYLVPEFGEGPSNRSWFGISFLASAVFSFMTEAKKSDPEESVVLKALALTCHRVVLALILLGMAGVVRWMAGWQ